MQKCYAIDYVTVFHYKNDRRQETDCVNNNLMWCSALSP